MAKFKVGDKVRLKKGLEVGKWYGGIPFFQYMKESSEANGGIHVVKEIRTTQSFTTYFLDHTYAYSYGEEMLEHVEEKEEEPDKTMKDFFEALALMSQLNTIMKRLEELMKSNEEE